MAVNALELRPRSTVALIDAAIRVCATSTGVWSLTLPAGVALIASLFNLTEAITRRQPLLEPVAWWTAAWAFRALSQGAACHFLEQEILDTKPPTARASFLAALKRAPGLITASMTMAVINVALWLFTAGLGFLFLGAHAAGYAATMHGQGSALNVYGTSAKMLGAARGNAAWVRLFGVTQLLVGLNLHLMIALCLYLAKAVLGLDVTFVNRFASLDNGTWVATLAVITFALFEPLRAATGTLLLIDGRVRQEGLDLVAAVAQLPTRRKKLAPLVASVLALLVAAPALGGDASLARRLHAVAKQCDMQDDVRDDLGQVDELPESERASLTRFVAHVERTAIDDEDCEAAEADLREGLRLINEAVAEEPSSADPAALARATLERPEFQATPPPTPEEAKEDEAPSAFSKWWDDLWRRLLEWLRDEDRKDTSRRVDLSGAPSPMAGANVVMILALVLIGGALLYLLLKHRGVKGQEDALDETGALAELGLSEDPASALSRPPETWAGLADQLAARGEFREAIRHLYLALLSRLHRDGVIDYDPTRSNWEYLLGFKGTSGHKSAFRELTRRFDFAWYGNLDVTQPSWSAFRATAEPILSTPAPEAPRA